MKLIVVSGMPGSGKEEFLKAAVSMGIPYVRMGDVVREHYDASGSDQSIGKYAGEERERHGPRIWAERCLEKMDGSVFLVDGCRSLSEVSAFRELTDDVIIVSIHSPPKVRYERLLARARSDAPESRAEFDERDAREMNWGLSDIIVLADHLILNDGSLKRFQTTSKKLLRELK